MAANSPYRNASMDWSARRLVSALNIYSPSQRLHRSLGTFEDIYLKV